MMIPHLRGLRIYLVVMLNGQYSFTYGDWRSVVTP